MSQVFAKPIIGIDPLSVLRREVCTMGGCPDGTAECFCAEIGRLNVRLNWIAKVINDYDYGTEEQNRLIRNHMSNVGHDKGRS